MRQAIEEGFILNVLKNYTTYGTYFELVEKKPEAKKNEFEKGKARHLLLMKALLFKWLKHELDKDEKQKE
ncbi:hypothetical protein [Candidatus Parabeggiatoa sp. HSG14]|uniref:hypothetical protein n=1 Tax=Candidatus Parabeggiatoa sp. HSG14 TaxID=3055593 RepID=UPI0025A725E9|nr:hypothetical protein [Thiotrichales bacterium HSG14]